MKASTAVCQSQPDNHDAIRQLPSALQELTGVEHKLVAIDPRRAFRLERHAANELIVVVSGMIAKFRTSGHSGKHTLGLHFQSDLILPHTGTRLFGLEAPVASVVMVVSQSETSRLVENSQKIREFFWRSIVREQRINHERILNLAQLDTRARVAHLICEIRERRGQSEFKRGDVPMTQQQIGEITGQTSVNVNRVLSDFKRLGYLEQDGYKLRVCDWAGLEEVACFNRSYLLPPT